MKNVAGIDLKPAHIIDPAVTRQQSDPRRVSLIPGIGKGVATQHFAPENGRW